mmetsp:Transcript_22478/g.33270  ORF Transcript_22478/g.33270 Transcript_22478/m.33270 type:complete len:365 (-) Transcript_22478:183-1277(-)
MTMNIENLITNLQRCKELPNFFRDKMDVVAAKVMAEMTKEARKFLYHELDDIKHTEDQVKAVIDIFPESLSMVNDRYGRLPVQNAAYHPDRVSFIPLLAKEGLRLNAGSEESRGGLLYGRENTLQALVMKEDDNSEVTAKYEKVLEDLHEMGLLKKGDIKKFELLYYALNSSSHQRFEMLADWDPDSLITTSLPNGKPLLRHSKRTCETVLTSGMKHFPERLGFLFRKYKGETICETYIERFGEIKAMSIICRCIPPAENHLLIHRAVEIVPHLEDKLIKYYPDEAFKKDATGRTLPQVKFHAQLRNGTQTFDNNASYFVNARDDEVEAKDPRSGLFPFMLAASNNRSDLDAVYYLLKRCPQVL